MEAVYEALKFASKALKRVIELLRLLADENVPIKTGNPFKEA